MKKLLYLLPMFMVSCGKFRDGSSIWSEGAWLVPTLPAIGGVIFLFFAIKAHLSGSEQWQKVNGVDKLVPSDENVPIHKIGQFWFAVALFVASLVIIVVQNLEK